jgi:hypothetical protein
LWIRFGGIFVFHQHEGDTELRSKPIWWGNTITMLGIPVFAVFTLPEKPTILDISARRRQMAALTQEV